MLVFKSRFEELENKYNRLLKEFVSYKSLYSYQSCNKSLKYENLMARAMKLKKENKENAYGKEKLEKATQKLEAVTKERDYLKSKMDKIINDEVNKRINLETEAMIYV